MPHTQATFSKRRVVEHGVLLNSSNRISNASFFFGPRGHAIEERHETPLRVTAWHQSPVLDSRPVRGFVFLNH